MGFFKVFKCSSKSKKRSKTELLYKLDRLIQENQLLSQKVAELTKTITKLQDANEELENRLKTEINEKQPSTSKIYDDIEITAHFEELAPLANQTMDLSLTESVEKSRISDESSQNLNISIISISEILETESEISDQLSSLENFSRRDPLAIRKMPTPLKKPPAQLSTSSYEKLFDRKTGRLRTDKSTQALIEKLRTRIQTEI